MECNRDRILKTGTKNKTAVLIEKYVQAPHCPSPSYDLKEEVTTYICVCCIAREDILSVSGTYDLKKFSIGDTRFALSLDVVAKPQNIHPTE